MNGEWGERPKEHYSPLNTSSVYWTRTWTFIYLQKSATRCGNDVSLCFIEGLYGLVLVELDLFEVLG